MRRKSNVIFAGLLVVVFVLGFATSTWTQGHHPEIRAAMHDLESAQHHLDRADRDFGGHKVKAMEHIRAAMGQLHEALEFDR
jgi:hypothetical protein